MAIADPLVTQQPSEITWSVVSRKNDGTQRLNVATSLTEPETLDFRHSTSKSGGVTIDRRNVTVSRVERESESGALNKAGVSITFTIPRTGQFTATEMERLLTIANEAIVEATLAALLRGET